MDCPGDTLTGGHGADTFVFPPNFGNETITNFDVPHDTMQLPHSEFANVAAVLADIHQVGANVEIAPDVHDVITLNNLSAAQLHASNFHLV
jgi:Ca2+-binding RTX toxin-like protein